MLRQLTQALVLLTFSAASVCLIRPADAHDTRADHHHDHKSSSNKSSKKTQKSEKPDPWHLLEMALTPAAYAATPRVTISTNSGYRFIRADGMPDHATGSFPNAGNPNRISEQTYDFRMPSQPAYATHTTPLGMARFGVAINGIPFDPGANEFFNGDPSTGWQYEAMYLGAKLGLDRNNAHVQPNGAYHYHGVPTALLQRLGKANRPVLLGYAADGFPIYGPFGYQDAKNPRSKMTKLQSSYRLRSGNRQSGPGGRYDGAFTQDYEYVKGAGDLDDCNGRVAVTPEFPKGTYHYVITESFPYIPRGFKGTPDDTFAKGPGGFGAMPGGGPGGRFGGGPGGQGGFGRRRMQGPHDSFRPDGLGSPGSFSGGGGFGGPPGGGGLGGPPGGGPPDGGFGGPPGRGFNGAHGGRQGYGSSQGSHYDPDRFGTGHSGSGSTSGGRFPGGGMSGREGGFGGQPGGGGFGGPPGGGGGGPPGGGFGGPPGGGFGGPPGGGFGGPPGGGFGGPPGGHGPPPGGELGSADFKPPGGATPPGGGALNNQSQHKQPNEESQQNLQQVPSKDEPAQESPADSPNSKGSTK